MLYKHYSVIIEISLKRHIYMYICMSIYILIIYLYTISMYLKVFGCSGFLLITQSALRGLWVCFSAC